MSDKYYLHNLVKNISFSGMTHDINISKEEFLQKCKDPQKKAAMEKVFLIFDKCDMTGDGNIDCAVTYNNGYPKWQLNMQDVFFKTVEDEKGKIDGYMLNMPDVILGEHISEDNFKEALEILNQIVEEKKKVKDEIEDKKTIDTLRTNNKEIPENVLLNIKEHISGDTSDLQIKIIDNGYEIAECVDGIDTVQKFNSAGEHIATTEIFPHGNDGGNFGVLESTTVLFDGKNNRVGCIEKYKGGYTHTQDNDGNDFLTYGKNEFVYTSKLEKITVNKGLPNETTFLVSMNDNREITDISNADNNQVLKMSDKTKELLTKLLNNGAVLGQGFDLKVNCNEVFVEAVKEEDMPDDIKKELDKCVNNALAAEDDYRVVKLEDGKYALDLLTHAATDYSCDKKRIIYSPDGTTETIEVKNNKLLITKNGETQVYELYDPAARKITYECFNFVISKPEEKNLANYERFKVQESDFSKNLNEVGKPEYVSDTEYSQKIGNDEYRVSILPGQISVQKNGKEFFINTQGMSDGVVKFISQSNPDALYTIAKKGVTIKLQAPPGGGDGEYVPEENVIYIAPDVSNIAILHRRIAHEAGHIYYTHENTVNKELEEMFNQESEAYEEELAAVIAQVPKGNDMLETKVNETQAKAKFSKWSDGDARYCATNVYEFVAEVYCLLVTGNAKSEFTIANVYPKTFELVKKMIAESGY